MYLTEAIELAARIAHVWLEEGWTGQVTWELQGENPFFDYSDDTPEHERRLFRCQIPVHEQITLHVEGVHKGPGFYVRLDNMGTEAGRLFLKDGEVGIQVFERAIHPEDGPIFFAAENVERMRRNCWLCGFKVNATTHEKLTWSQSVPREMVERWGLQENL